MSQNGLTHLCWNCDGQVPFNEPACPYCGVELRYQDGAQDTDQYEEAKSADTKKYFESDWSQAMAVTAEKEAEHAKQQGVQGILLPLCLLLAGGVFAFFGLLILLFSQNGEFVLRWSSGYWMLYLGLGLPLCYAGYRLLGTLKD